jgi:hypothetical protein
LAKYWSKFSSPESTVPHGVTPPEQLFCVPRTVRPDGSADVLRNFEPAAGPRTSKIVSSVIRRPYRLGTTSRPPRIGSRRVSSTDRPCAAQAIFTCSSVGSAGSY